jgi:hypothetical protein
MKNAEKSDLPEFISAEDTETETGLKTPSNVSVDLSQPQSRQPHSLRSLFSVASPTALALFLSACGKSLFGGSKSAAPKLTQKNDPNAGDLGGGGSVKNVNPAELPAGAATPGQDAVIDPCYITGAGIVELPAEEPTYDFKFVAYGQRYSSMVVVKSRSGKIMAGDFVMLGEVLPNNKVRVLGRKRANSVDQSLKLIMFDGLNFGTSTTEPLPQLVVLVNRETISKRSVLWRMEFVTQISRPAANNLNTEIKVGATKYGIVDFNTKNHSNYWDNANLNISLEFGNPSASIVGAKQYMQANDEGGAQGQSLHQSKLLTSQWLRPTGLPNTNYFVCDAFGDLLFSAGVDYKHAGFPVTDYTNILHAHSSLLFYVCDGPGKPDEHYHRYFFHIG